ncbi:MAG: 4Fe-4S dicluster domain-containing protein [Candidatus Omnitrophica bacterium]|nr:4Fe-4S dicluster domain-containing protein [Candidatus Omnitrophota bacterium]
MSKAQWCRRGVATLVFAGLTGIFFGLFSVSGGLIRLLPLSQIVPALRILSLGGIIFLFILLVLTALCGRLYCSFLCPLGIYQDVILWLGGRFKKLHLRYQAPLYRVKIPLAALFLLSLLLHRTPLVILLDPYAQYGRFITNLFKPFVGILNNGAGVILEWFGFYRLPFIHLHYVNPAVFTVVFAFFIAVSLPAAVKGRWYCNTLCPLGTILGALSRHSLFRIRFNETTCVTCGNCERECKARCIDSRTRRVDSGECVSCFNCLAVCPNGSLSFSAAPWARSSVSGREKRGASEKRRTFLKAFFLSFVLPGTARMSREAYRDRMAPVTPPGSLGEAHFSSKCIACNLCVSVCPNNVLVPSLFDYGWQGILQPKMNYGISFCSYECNACSQVCPTGAIRPISIDLKKTVQLGVSFIEQRYCIPYVHRRDCGACAEHCPTKAVYMVRKGEVFVPETNPKVCIGCGVCEYVCPARPKAITVTAHAVHRTAMLPDGGEAITQDKSVTYELPF